MKYAVMTPPDVMIDVANQDTADVRLINGYAYDFVDGKIVMTTNGRTVKDTGAASYLLWVIKNLSTERYERAAYSTDIGIEFRAIARKGYPKPIAESELKRSITEALMVDERTVDVSQFTFRWDGPNCYVRFELESIYGRDTINRMLGVVTGHGQ